MLLFLAAATSSAPISLAPLIIAVITLLIGSGGILAILDRRSVQASRLASEAVSATDVFKASLQEERRRRAEIELSLQNTHEELTLALASATASAQQANTNAQLIDALHHRIRALERDLMHSLQDVSEVVRRMFTNGHTEEYMIERWRTVMEATKLSVIQTDRTGHILFVSDEANTLLGYTIDALHGKPIAHIIDDADKIVYRNAVAEAISAELEDRVIAPVCVSILDSQLRPCPMWMAIGVHISTITMILRPVEVAESPAQAISDKLLNRGKDSPSVI